MKTALFRWLFNYFPAYRGTGGWVTYIARDWKEVHIKLPLNWTTRNYVSTIFGGSLYGAADPIYMLMLIKILGPEYIVWDKAASIQFIKPGKRTLYATFNIDDAEIQHILRELVSQASIDRHYEVNWVDQDGVVHACVEKTIYIRKKSRARL